MFPNNTSYASYLVTYIDNNNRECQTKIICPMMRHVETFEKEYKGQYSKVIGYKFIGFLIQ